MKDEDRLWSFLERMDARQDEQGRMLERNTASLEEHIRRTNALEAQILPIKAHVTLMNNTAKLFSVLAGAALLAHQLGLL